MAGNAARAWNSGRVRPVLVALAALVLAAPATAAGPREVWFLQERATRPRHADGAGHARSRPLAARRPDAP